MEKLIVKYEKDEIGLTLPRKVIPIQSRKDIKTILNILKANSSKYIFSHTINMSTARATHILEVNDEGWPQLTYVGKCFLKKNRK